MNKPLDILVFIDWYLPGFKAGGPIRSVANLVHHLPHRFWIVTSAFDHDSTSPYEGVPTDTWVQRRPNENVWYCASPPSRETLRKIISERPYDRFYLNSLFSIPYAIKPLMALRKLGHASNVILAPRGMLKPGALSIKATRKKWFIQSTRKIGLYRGITWAASNEMEAKEIRQHFGDQARVLIAPNLPKSAIIRNTVPKKTSGNLRLIMVARVSPEKNIHGAIDYLTDAIRLWKKASDTAVLFELDVYGTLQNEGYLASCRQAAEKHPSLQINFKGECRPEELLELYNHYHFFFLPTLGENYGHAIAEALISGLPAIISDRTPWKALESHQAGWELPLDDGTFARILLQCAMLEHVHYQPLCEGAAAYAQKFIFDPSAMEANRQLFSANFATDVP